MDGLAWVAMSVSNHELAVFRVLAEAQDRWVTSPEIAERADVAPRTARAHALNLVKLGVVERAEVFPANRYQLSANASEHPYVRELIEAARVLDVELPPLRGGSR